MHRKGTPKVWARILWHVAAGLNRAHQRKHCGSCWCSSGTKLRRSSRRRITIQRKTCWIDTMMERWVLPVFTVTAPSMGSLGLMPCRGRATVQACRGAARPHPRRPNANNDTSRMGQASPRRAAQLRQRPGEVLRTMPSPVRIPNPCLPHDLMATQLRQPRCLRCLRPGNNGTTSWRTRCWAMTRPARARLPRRSTR